MATTAASGYHPGELLVQQQAGVVADAARLTGMLRPAQLDGGPARWLAERTFAVLTSRDGDARLWTVPLLGAPGFLRGAGATLAVGALPDPRGPLARPVPGSAVGLIVVEFATRRRFRINGTLATIDEQGLVIDADQAYGNCPSYIQRRGVEITLGAGATAEAVASTELTAEQRKLISTADTFFLGTVHTERGADSSHKGGPVGFVRADADGSLWWPDYAGNNMFNSLGNLVDDPEASALFLDFTGGSALYLSGTAGVEWTAPGAPGDDGDTGRRVRMRPERVMQLDLGLRGGTPDPSPVNPDLRTN